MEAKTKKLSIDHLKKAKMNGQKITMLTAYNYPFAKMIDEAGVDVILVGDSLGMVELGYESTLPVTMEEMIHHTKAVTRAVKRALVVGDMPFMSYQVSRDKAIRNAGRFIKEGGCDAIKIEGADDEIYELVAKLTRCGVPVVAHIGLTPQKALTLGGYKVQGKEEDDALLIKKQARELESAGAVAIVLECIPKMLSKEITEETNIPTIGIGAGKYCDGQVLVTYDIIGLFDRFTPKFVKRYCNISTTIKDALNEFVNEVKNNKFPDDEHSF